MGTDQQELAAAIARVLAQAAKGKGREPSYLTAYQILRRLPTPLSQLLINEYGEPGKGAGRNFSAVSRVAQVARAVADKPEYLDAHELAFEYADGEQLVEGGNRVVGLYRAPRTTGETEVAAGSPDARATDPEPTLEL